MPANQKIKVASFLAQLPLFNELEETELAQIAEHTTELHVAKGDKIFERGDPCTGFHTVVYGRIKLFFTSSQGNEKVVEIIGPGHSFGEALMFMNKPYIVTAQAVADTMLLHVAKDAIMNEIERHPGFACKMLAGLSRRLHGLICDVEAYSLNSGTQRVIGYLLKEIQQDGEKVELPTSKTIVASRLNLTPEHFSRILHDLAEQSFIEVNGREITIVSVEKLRTYDK